MKAFTRIIVDVDTHASYHPALDLAVEANPC